MKTPELPGISGVKPMSPLEMNDVRFNRRHTVLTPELLASLRTAATPRPATAPPQPSPGG